MLIKVTAAERLQVYSGTTCIAEHPVALTAGECITDLAHLPARVPVPLRPRARAVAVPASPPSHAGWPVVEVRSLRVYDTVWADAGAGTPEVGS